MNSLGQIKALLEWQSLQHFSGQPPSSGMPVSTSFSALLQEFVHSQSSTGYVGPAVNSLNTLGQVFQNSQFHLQSHPPATEKAKNVYGTDFPKSGSSIENIIQRAADTYNLSSKLIKAVIRHESNFNPRAISRAGAAGLMQLMPSTARSLGVTDMMDPEQNVMAGAKYLRNMLDKYKGNVKLALAAYNAGPGNVDKYGGIPPFKETQNYVQKVTNTFFG